MFDQADGKSEVQILSNKLQTDVTTNVVTGKADVFYADSPVAGYAISQTDGQLEALGDVEGVAKQGIAIKKGDQQLDEAVQKAVHTSIVFSLLGGIVAAFENGSVRGCTNRGDVLARSKGQAGGIAATTWNGGNSRIESCRNGGVVKGMFGLAGSILGEGRTATDRIEACGVGGELLNDVGVAGIERLLPLWAPI